MIRVAFRRGLLGELGTQWHDVPWRPGIAARDIIGAIEVAVGRFGVRAVVAIDGERIGDDCEVQDGTTVLVALQTGEAVIGIVIYAIVSAAVSVAVNYAISLLTPTPKPPGIPQDRGDDSSPTYAWDSIQTSYGAGLTRAVVLGRFAVGGTVIYSRTVADITGRGEVLVIVLALSVGPVRRIGQYTASTQRLGSYSGHAQVQVLPEGLYINDNLQDTTGTVLPEVEAYLRLGFDRQSPLPTSTFPGASTLYVLNDPLNTTNDEVVWTFADDDRVPAVQVNFYAPAGVYDVGPQGQVIFAGVQFTYRWRPVGETAWRVPYTPTGGSSAFGNPAGTTGALAVSIPMALVGPTAAIPVGPLQIQVVRQTAAGNATVNVNAVILRSIEVQRPASYAYPGTALMGLAIHSNGTFGGSLPRFRQRVDGLLVRVWDPTYGFSGPTWDTAAVPFDFATTPGRSPAWLFGEFATNKEFGLGNEYTDADIDWPRLREWGAFCQQFPNGGWLEPRYRCGIVLDQARPAIETLIAIAWSGGASLCFRNGLLSVVFQYRDAFNELGVVVPAKVPVQLISGALCEDVQVRWLKRKGRTTAIDYQYLNEDLGFAQATARVIDMEAVIDDPIDPRSEPLIVTPVQAIGVSSRSQLVRMGTQAHRVSRLIRRELTFKCGPWLLAAEPGDLFDFQHNLLRAFESGGEDSVARAAQCVLGTVSGNEITIDHKVLVGDQVACRLADGSPLYRTCTGVVTTTYRGREATIVTLDGAAFSLATGAAVICGEADKLTQTYQIVAISLEPDMKRVVRALQWVPEVFDDVPLSYAELGQDTDQIVAPPIDATDAIAATDIRVARALDGAVEVSWTVPAKAAGASAARVFARQFETDDWSFVAETDRTSARFERPPGWRTMQVSVALAVGASGFAAAGTTFDDSLEVPEFPGLMLPAPTGVQVASVPAENRLDVSWQQLRGHDVIGYELRLGDDWAAGKVLYRGQHARARLVGAPAYSRMQLAAQHRSGMFGVRAIIDQAVGALPYAGAVVHLETEFAPTNAGGTHASTMFGSGVIELVATAYEGTFTSTTQALGFEAPFWLRVALSSTEEDGATIAELAAVEAGSGESFWRTPLTRPASIGRPGINWSIAVSDVSGLTLEQIAQRQANGLALGEAGTNVRADVESRVYAGGAWSAWSPHVDRLVTCSQWEARVKLGRTELRRRVSVSTLKLQALI